MHSGFLHRKQEHDYYDSLKKLVKLLVEQLQSHLQVQSTEVLINQKVFTNQLLQLYTRLHVLESQRKLPSYTSFSDLCQQLYCTLHASSVIHDDQMPPTKKHEPRPLRSQRTQSNVATRQSSAPINAKHSYLKPEKVRFATEETEVESTKPILVENSFCSTRSNLKRDSQSTADRHPQIVPRHIFQDKPMAKLFVQSNGPPLYITNSPVSLEVHQRNSYRIGRPEKPTIIEVVNREQY